LTFSLPAAGRFVSFFCVKTKERKYITETYFGDTKKVRRKKKGKSIPQSLTSTRAHNAAAFRTLLCVTLNGL
jgi:hypothetical protein